jgi:hypothetical protein
MLIGKIDIDRSLNEGHFVVRNVWTEKFWGKLRHGEETYTNSLCEVLWDTYHGDPCDEIRKKYGK